MVGAYNKVAEHFPLATNVLLYYPRRSVIVHKYEVMREDSLYKYIQGYTPKIPLCVKYSK